MPLTVSPQQNIFLHACIPTHCVTLLPLKMAKTFGPLQKFQTEQSPLAIMSLKKPRLAD